MRALSVLVCSVLVLLTGCRALGDSRATLTPPDTFWYVHDSLDEAVLRDLRSSPDGEKLPGWMIAGWIDGGRLKQRDHPGSVWIANSSRPGSVDRSYLLTGKEHLGEDGARWCQYEVWISTE